MPAWETIDLTVIIVITLLDSVPLRYTGYKLRLTAFNPSAAPGEATAAPLAALTDSPAETTVATKGPVCEWTNDSADSRLVTQVATLSHADDPSSYRFKGLKADTTYKARHRSEL